MPTVAMHAVAPRTVESRRVSCGIAPRIGARARAIAALAAGVCVASVAPAAQAQQGVALGQDEAGVASDRFELTPEPTVVGRASVWADAAIDSQLGFRHARADGDAALVLASAQLGAVFVDRFSLHGRVGIALGEASGVSFDDVELAGRATVFGERGDPFALGGAVGTWVPVGSESAFRSDGKARVAIRALGGGDVGDVTYTAHVGFLARREADVGDVTIGPSVLFGGGASLWVLERSLLLGPEVVGHSVLPLSGLDVGIDRSVPAEILMTAHAPRVLAGWSVSGHVGTGLTPTPGTSIVRLGLSLEREIELDPDWDDDGIDNRDDRCPDVPGAELSDADDVGCPDRDRDGIADRVDACVEVAGIPHADPTRHGCPSDRDEDRIVDEDDACPDEPGIASENPKTHGCPPDRDGDAVFDRDDACVDVPGVVSSIPTEHGCPPDRDGDAIRDPDDACVDVAGVASDDPRAHGCPPNVDADGDGIFDTDDACPAEAGEASEEPDRHGCPRLARLCGPNDAQICLEDKIHFAFASADILPESFELLADVSAILEERTDILLLSVEGHTDGVGNPIENQKLSEARAASVVEWLVDIGDIDAARLTSRGFGQKVPIADNATDEGRAKNRRVEFIVKRRAP